MTTGLWSVGSITDHVGAIVGWTNIPSSISGTVFSNMVEQEINFVEQYTSATITSSAIPEKYQPPLIDLLLSKVLLMVDAQSGGVNNVSLGDLSIAKGSSSNADLAQQLKTDAFARLKELHRTVRFTRVIGGY